VPREPLTAQWPYSEEWKHPQELFPGRADRWQAESAPVVLLPRVVLSRGLPLAAVPLSRTRPR